MIFNLIKSAYIYYVTFFSSIYEVILPNSLVTFLTAYSVNFFPIMLLSRKLLGMPFSRVIRHGGLWIYIFIISAVWLLMSNDGQIGFDKKLESNVLQSLIISFVGMYGILSLRGRLVIIDKAIQRNKNRNRK